MIVSFAFCLSLCICFQPCGGRWTLIYIYSKCGHLGLCASKQSLAVFCHRLKNQPSALVSASASLASRDTLVHVCVCACACVYSWWAELWFKGRKKTKNCGRIQQHSSNLHLRQRNESASASSKRRRHCYHTRFAQHTVSWHQRVMSPRLKRFRAENKAMWLMHEQLGSGHTDSISLRNKLL